MNFEICLRVILEIFVATFSKMPRQRAGGAPVQARNNRGVAANRWRDRPNELQLKRASVRGGDARKPRHP